MLRIIFTVARLIFIAPYYLIRIWWCGKSNKITFEESFSFVKRVATSAVKAGRVKIEAYGIENIPKENGFVFFPNHQGLFDMLVFFQTCPVPFSFVIKKEASKIILLKQVVDALDGLAMDREDVRQSMKIINEMTENVKKGRNYIIFAEGTRSHDGNNPLDFKGGSFKSAVKAKCPIVPCALIDSYKPYDENSIRPLTVKVVYLQPIYYEEYAGMKTVEIAQMVRERIIEAIQNHI